jgi:hypothetical protein
MFRVGVDTFVPIINFLNDNRVQKVFFVINKIIKRVFSLVIYKNFFFWCNCCSSSKVFIKTNTQNIFFWIF